MGSIQAVIIADLMSGGKGARLLVSGQYNPLLRVPPGATCRFRLYNATNARYLRLAFEDHEMTLIGTDGGYVQRSEEHTSELQSQSNIVCRLLLEKKKNKDIPPSDQANRRRHTK